MVNTNKITYEQYCKYEKEGKRVERRLKPHLIPAGIMNQLYFWDSIDMSKYSNDDFDYFLVQNIIYVGINHPLLKYFKK